MSSPSAVEFARLKRLPPYVFNITSELKMAARRRGEDIIDFGMGNPDGPTPPHIVAKLVETVQRSDTHGYSVSRGIPRLRRAICQWYQRRWGIEFDPETEAIVTIGSEEGIAHLTLATLGRGDTVYLCAVDKDRNCVSLIQSNYMGFGSGLVPGDLGFALQNRGTLFALDATAANRLEPHKRPFHTIIPAMVTKGGKPWFVFGVMGGDMQPQGQVQVLVNLIDFGMNVQEAGEAPRLEHVGSATPKGTRGDRDGGTVHAERGISEKILTELRRRGHQVKQVKTNGGGYQGIRIDRQTNMLHGGSEARKDGCAVGY